VTSPAERSRSFGAHADLYDRLRPGYPAAAVEAALPFGSRRVADVGAGTGKLTAVLLAEGLEVIAVEPDDAMRAVLADQLSGVDVRAGAAEQLPLFDAEVDAVLYAQAWHWAEPEPAAREARRVLAPGGTLAMLWNWLDDRVRWVAELNWLTHIDAGIIGFPDPPPLVGFAGGRRVDIAWRQTLSKAQLVDLVRTWSAVSTRPDTEREQVLCSVRHLLDHTSDLSGQDLVELPYVCSTRAYRRSPDSAEDLMM